MTSEDLKKLAQDLENEVAFAMERIDLNSKSDTPFAVLLKALQKVRDETIDIAEGILMDDANRYQQKKNLELDSLKRIAWEGMENLSLIQAGRIRALKEKKE